MKFILASHEKSTFDHIVLASQKYTTELLGQILKLLTPFGKLSVQKWSGDTEALIKDLKLSGFINAKSENDYVICEKPSYEVGSAVKLTFAPKNTIKSNDKEKIASVWKINLNEDDDLIDPDDLLDEEDKVKPDQASLRGKEEKQFYVQDE